MYNTEAVCVAVCVASRRERENNGSPRLGDIFSVRAKSCIRNRTTVSVMKQVVSLAMVICVLTLSLVSARTTLTLPFKNDEVRMMIYLSFFFFLFLKLNLVNTNCF